MQHQHARARLHPSLTRPTSRPLQLLLQTTGLVEVVVRQYKTIWLLQSQTSSTPPLTTLALRSPSTPPENHPVVNKTCLFPFLHTVDVVTSWTSQCSAVRCFWCNNIKKVAAAAAQHRQELPQQRYRKQSGSMDTLAAHAVAYPIICSIGADLRHPKMVC